MISTSDLIKILDVIPAWKEIRELPAKVELLAKRIDALEKSFAPANPYVCPKCREETFGVIASRPGKQGWINRKRECSKCGYIEFRDEKI